MVKIGNIELGDFPIFLAPMEDITDYSFRSLCKGFGADMVYTEFTASDGLIRDVKKSFDKIRVFDDERPVGVQIFGNDIDSMKASVEFAEKSNPELIDINFGCSVRKIAKKGCGAGILNDIPKMIKITDAVVRSTKLPVTVKTRLGWDENNKNIVEISERLQDVGIKAITIHGRTKAQMFRGYADWTLIGEVKNNPKIFIPVIGNGDVDSPEKALELKKKYNVDGIMIGRASIGNPWIFREIKHFLNRNEILPAPSIQEKVEICRKHLQRCIEVRGEKTGILVLRRHYGDYFKGLADFRKYRIKLVTSVDYEEICKTLDDISQNYKI